MFEANPLRLRDLEIQPYRLAWQRAFFFLLFNTIDEQSYLVWTRNKGDLICNILMHMGHHRTCLQRQSTLSLLLFVPIISGQSVFASFLNIFFTINEMRQSMKCCMVSCQSTCKTCSQKLNFKQQVQTNNKLKNIRKKVCL